MLEHLPELHGQIHGLGGAWILLGLIHLGGAAFLLTSEAADDVASIGSGGLLLLGAFGVCWITVGIGAFLKKLWSIRAGLVAGYLSIALGLAFALSAGHPPSPGAAGIQIILIWQAHRVLRGVKRRG